MRKACRLSELASGGAARLNTWPHTAVFHKEELQVRSHAVTVIDGDILVAASTEVPNLPPGLTVDGHV